MSDEALTFSELRKVQKEEKRKEGLVELEDSFLLRVSNYFETKKDTSGNSREYKNALRVFKKIISLREDKIVKNAKIAVKTGKTPDNMLPREKELFRQMKEIFGDHRERIDEMTEQEHEEDSFEPETTTSSGEEPEIEEPAPSPETETAEEPEVEEEVDDSTENGGETEPEEDEEEIPEGYQIVKIVSQVPEFMGTDLETYGPFEEGEEAQIPEDNAEILVNRGNAEMIE